MDEYLGIGKPLFPPDEEGSSRVGRREAITEDEERERSEESKKRLKAFDEAWKLPQVTSERSSEKKRRREEEMEEKAMETPEKKELERHQRELLELEVSATKRKEMQKEKERVERMRDMARQEELTLQAERKAAEMRKEKREEERRAAEKRLMMIYFLTCKSLTIVLSQICTNCKQNSSAIQ